MNTTILAIGDLHGHIAPLEALLKTCERKGLMAAPNLVAEGVQIVFLGDYIDRGSEGRAVLERVCALRSANPGRVHCLLGNHEMLALASLGVARELVSPDQAENDKEEFWESRYEWTPHGREGGADLIRDFGGFRDYLRALSRNAPLGAFLRSLEPAVELSSGTARALFVHAGIPSRLRNRPAFDAELRALRALLRDEVALTDSGFNVAQDPRTDADSLIGDRSIPRRRLAGLNHLPSALGVDIIVIGHTRHERITRYGTSVYAIDVSGQMELSGLLLRARGEPCVLTAGGRIQPVSDADQ